MILAVGEKTNHFQLHQSKSVILNKGYTQEKLVNQNLTC